MSFDLSTTNILLASAVIALFVAFVFILMKLQPTTENKQSQEPKTKVDKEETQPPPSPQPLRNLPSSPETMENSSKGSKPFTAPTQTAKPTAIENQTKLNTPPPARIENRDAPKQSKPMLAPVRAELAPTRKDCIHFYGYLHSLPKNTPIPDECFGCVKIVDCLINPNSTGSSLNLNHNSNHNHNSKKRGWL